MGIRNKIDALLIAGDLFDIPNPKAELFDFVASEFKRGGFPVFIICGNRKNASQLSNRIRSCM